MQIRNLILLFLCGFMAIKTMAQPVVSFVVDTQAVSESIGTYQIAVTIANADANATSVDINVVGGNAVYGTNFTYGPVTVTFPASSSFTQVFTVTVIDDSIPDGNMNVIFALANPTNSATIGSPSQFTLTMVDADTPKLTVNPTTATQFDYTPGLVNVPVNLNRGVRDTTKVQVKLVPGGTTAVPGVDFNFTNTTLVWPPDSAGYINAGISLINNAFYERDRTVQLALSSPTNGGVLTDTTFTLTIPANPGYSQTGCSDLFFGQYIEGSGSNKALQIYNPTSVSIDLSVYSILISANAGANMSVYPLSGTLAAGGVYVVANPNASSSITSLANATNSFFNFDGTDAVALLHNTDTIDIIGQLYVNPGPSGWSVGSGSTYQHTLIRNYYDHAGDTSWTNAWATWNSYPVDMVDSLGFHNTAPCGRNGPVGTVRILEVMDSFQVGSDPSSWIIYPLIVEVYNPTDSIISFDVGPDSNSTAIRVQNIYNAPRPFDYVFEDANYVNGPGISYDTSYFYVIGNPLVSPVKNIHFRFLSVSDNAIAIADSGTSNDIGYDVYLVDPNVFNVSFLGAGYTYPKDTPKVEIPVVIDDLYPYPTSVDVSLSSGSAVNGQDFIFNDTTITFPAYSADTQGVWVTILNNNIYQGNKQANFNLSNPTNGAMLGINGFTLTIINNDSLEGIASIANATDVNLFPNPVKDLLSLKTSNELNKIEVTDLLGNVVKSLDKIYPGISSLNVSELPAGVFFINFIEEGNLRTMRFVKSD